MQLGDRGHGIMERPSMIGLPSIIYMYSRCFSWSVSSCDGLVAQLKLVPRQARREQVPLGRPVVPLVCKTNYPESVKF